MAKINSYKKYMKKSEQKDYSLLKIFIISFCLMLICSTFIFKEMLPKVDTSVGDYKQEEIPEYESKRDVDNRLALLQQEDSEQQNFEINFSEMSRSNKISDDNTENTAILKEEVPIQVKQSQEKTYKVYIGSYSSVEEAKAAKDLIIEVNIGLNPIVKYVDANTYSLQIGAFKSKEAANNLLNNVQRNNIQARIVEEY